MRKKQSKSYLFINQTKLEYDVLSFYSRFILSKGSGWQCYLSSSDLQLIDNECLGLIEEGYKKVNLLPSPPALAYKSSKESNYV